MPRQLGEKGRAVGGKATAPAGWSVVGEGSGRRPGAGEAASRAEGLYPGGGGMSLTGFKLTSELY